MLTTRESFSLNADIRDAANNQKEGDAARDVQHHVAQPEP